MPNQRKETSYDLSLTERDRPAGLLKLGLIAASSALAGGLAASWWHRRTLTKLQNPILLDEIQKLGLSEEDFVDEDFPIS